MFGKSHKDESVALDSLVLGKYRIPKVFKYNSHNLLLLLLCTTYVPTRLLNQSAQAVENVIVCH